MSFAGSVLAMITSLKNNALPRRRAFKLLKENERLQSGYKKELKFKQVSKEDLEIIKQQIRERAYKQRKRNIIIVIPMIITGLIFITCLILDVKEQEQREHLQRLEQQKIKEKELYDKYLYYMNDGYKWLKKERYHNAKFQFEKAAELRPDNYSTKFAIF